MTFLYVILGIVIFFIVVLSIPLHISIGYDDKIRVSIRYLFIKLNLLPVNPRPKKEKKPKEESQAEPEPAPEQLKKEKKPNPIVEMVKANGYDGMMTVLSNLVSVLRIYGGRLFRSVVFDEIYLYILVGTGDAASTAIKYGQTCQRVYPLMGFICSNNVVRSYDIDVDTDFLANKTQGEFFIDLHLCIRKIINATIAMVIRLLFRVVFTFLRGGRKKPDSDQSDNKNMPQ